MKYKMPRKYRSGAKKAPTGRRRRPALRRKRAPRTGGFYVKRRMQIFALQGSTIVPGTAVSTNTQVLTLGTPTVAQSGGANLWDVPFSLQFALDDLDQYSDLTNIADRYRIVSAALKLTTSNIALGAGAGLLMPTVQYIVDHDDATPPNVSVISQKMGVRNIGFNQRGQCSMYCKPVPSGAILNGAGGITAAAVLRRSPYINSTHPDIPHYGIKGVFRSVFLSGATSTANISIDCVLTVHCKDLQ